MGAPGGVAVAQRDKLGCTPLFIACQKGNASVVVVLLRSSGVRTSANASDFEYGATALGMACANGHSACVRQQLRC